MSRGLCRPQVANIIKRMPSEKLMKKETKVKPKRKYVRKKLTLWQKIKKFFKNLFKKKKKRSRKK